MTSDSNSIRDDDPFDLERQDEICRLRDVLHSHNYESKAILQAIGIQDFPELGSSNVGWLERQTAGGSPLETLIRLLLIGIPVEITQVRRAVEPMTLENWVQIGLLAVEGDEVRGAGQLLPYEGWLLFADMPLKRGGSLRHNHVMAVGSSSITLAKLTVRRPIERALDLGTGGGIQAFFAAPHSRQVVAVDRNPRAVNVAAFNACLNGLKNIDCRVGDFFAPVAQEKFDLIVSNPPFVVSPEKSYIYRDGGMHGDQVCQHIVREAPALLNEGGYCQLLCNWAHLEGQPWQERLANWSSGAGCDVWVMRSETRDAAAYARHWIRHTERDSEDDFHRRFSQWMKYYEAEGIVEMSAGTIVLRRRTTKDHWFKIDEAPPQMLGPCGDDVHRMFTLRDYLVSLGSIEALLDERLIVSPEVRLEQQFAPSEEGWYATDSQLRRTAGLAYTGSVDPYTAHMLGKCNGRLQVRDLFSDMAQRVGQPVEHIIPAGLQVIQRLVEQGFLQPAARD